MKKMQGGAMGMVLLYRKNLFDSKGVAYPTASWTWDAPAAKASRRSASMPLRA